MIPHTPFQRLVFVFVQAGQPQLDRGRFKLGSNGGARAGRQESGYSMGGSSSGLVIGRLSNSRFGAG